MYKIKIENAKELKDGRSLRKISEIIGVTEQYLSKVFNQKSECSKTIVISLISIKKKVSVNDEQMEDYIRYYFE